MKKISVDIDDVVLAMQHRDREISEEYLDIFTGDVINMPQDVIDALEGEGGTDVEDLSDWEKELVSTAEAILQDEEGRYLLIPEAPSHEAYDEMVAFAHSVEDAHLRELLLGALDGRGAFRRFNDVLGNHPEERERWLKWQNEYERRMVIEWLNSEGFEIEDRSHLP